MLVAAFGCVKPKADLLSYYDLKQTLADQARVLSAGNFRLEKTANIADSSETKTLDLDSTGWMDQFAMLMEFSLTEPALIGAFEVTQSGKTETYIQKEDQRVAIKHFEITDSDQNIELSGELIEDKSIYTDTKRMRLTIQNGRMTAFHLIGWQKMLLKDTMKYSILGKVIAQ